MGVIDGKLVDWDDCCDGQDNCEDPQLPPVTAFECVNTIEEHLSELCNIYVAPINLVTSDDFVENFNWEDPTSWAQYINNTDTGDYIRCLNIIGSIGEGTSTVREKSKGRKKNSKKVRPFDATLDDASDLNYEFVKSIECGANVCIWYATRGCKLYGGNSGIPMYITGDWPLLAGSDSYEGGKITGEFQTCLPPRITNPIATAA